MKRKGEDEMEVVFVGSNLTVSKHFFFVSIFGLKMALHVFIETEGKFAFNI